MLNREVLSSKIQFKSRPLTYLSELQKEIDLNHDMQELLDKSRTGRQLSSPTQLLMFVEDAFKRLLEVRESTQAAFSINKQMLEASFLFRRFLLANINCETQGCTCLGHIDVREALSLLWTFSVTSVDMCLTQFQQKIDNLSAT